MRTLLALLLILGSGSLTSALPAPRTIDITGGDTMKYNVTTIRAKAGESIRLRLKSTGTLPKVAMAHNVVVLKPGTDPVKFVTEGAAHRATDFVAPSMSAVVVAKTPFAGPGETVEVVFTVPKKPGTYPFLCTFPGHLQAGMQGTLIVS